MKKPEISVTMTRAYLLSASIDALRASKDDHGRPRIYRRGTKWARWRTDGSVQALTVASMLTELARAASWYKLNSRGEAVWCDPPLRAARAVLAEIPTGFPECPS